MSLRDELRRRFPRLSLMPRGCYVVGGAIRDLHLGVAPVDVDVAAPDPLSAANAAGKRVIRLGSVDHLSAWRVVDGEHIYDFAALEGGNISVDLERRDFTIDAMAVSLDDGTFLDPFGGLKDIDARAVRMIKAENFDDDPLRCLKAVRIAVRFDFEIDGETLSAIRSRAASISTIAAERVTYEIGVIFSAGRFRKAIALLHETGLDGPLFGRGLDARSFGADDVSLAGALALLVDEPRTYAKRWRWSDVLMRDVVALKQLLRTEGDLLMPLYDAGERVARQLPAVLRTMGREASIAMPDFAMSTLLTGDEIASIRGVPPGPDLGRLKRALLEAQLKSEVQTRSEAEQYVLAWRLE